MVPAPAPVEDDAVIHTVLDTAGTREWAAVLVGRGSELAGVGTRAALVGAAASGHSADRLGSLLQGSPLHLHPDHAADVVIERPSIPSRGRWEKNSVRTVISVVGSR